MVITLAESSRSGWLLYKLILNKHRRACPNISLEQRIKNLNMDKWTFTTLKLWT